MLGNGDASAAKQILSNTEKKLNEELSNAKLQISEQEKKLKALEGV